MPTSTILYPKQTQNSAVTVSYSYDTLTISGSTASTGIFITVVPDPVEIATTTVVPGATGSGQSTITSTVANAFKFVPVNSVITLKSGSEGSAVLPASTTVVSKPNEQTLIVDKENTTASASAGASTIISTAPSGNKALMKLSIDLTGLGTSTYNPKTTVYYYSGDVTYAAANASNASETVPLTKAINMTSFLQKAGIAAVNTETLDVSS